MTFTVLRNTVTALPLVTMLALAACGGGGSGGKRDSPNAMMQKPAAETATARAQEAANAATEAANAANAARDAANAARDAATAAAATAAEARDAAYEAANAATEAANAAEAAEAAEAWDAANAAAAAANAARDAAEAAALVAALKRGENITMRPALHTITTVDGNLLAIDHAAPNRRVENGSLVRREPVPQGVRWITNTEYNIIGNLLPDSSRQLGGEDYYWDSWYFYGSWSNNNMRLSFGGYEHEPSTGKQIAGFGVSLENDEFDPWAYGVEPPTNFADNPRIQALDTAYYYGTLVGLTSSTKQPMGANVDIELYLGTDITGTFGLDGLSTIEKDGSLQEFLGGTLVQTIAVDGNTFTTTGGDAGTVTGIFVGEDHDAVTGTFQHSAFIGAFSAGWDD